MSNATPNRLKCPYCQESVPGIEIIGGTIAARYNGDMLTFERGTVPCKCGARLVVLLGSIMESVAPLPKPKGRDTHG